MATRTKSAVLKETTLDYLKTIDPANPPTAHVIEAELLDRIAETFGFENSTKPKNQQWHIPDTLSFAQIAEIVNYLYPVCSIPCAGENSDPSYDVMAIYQDSGPNAGTYGTSEDTFRKIARDYNYNLSAREFTEFMQVLHDIAPRKLLTQEQDFVAVNNGIFNYKNKTLLPFSPKFVFLSKSHVDYIPNAINPVLHNPDDNTDWDIESWMTDLSDDPEIVTLLWEILGAIIRPNVHWNKSAWLYSETGNNGKGTLCELMRQLCGPGTYASISISDFSKEFVLEPLIRATAIIVDENDVGSFIDKAANLKAVITNDVIQINRKFKTPVSFQFRGFMVQCLNEFPRIKDKSDSFYRRQIFIPMAKCFTGRERKYIKSDYLHRKEVLEYVLCKVLNTDYYSLSEPQACKNVLSEYKDFNDPIRQFADEILPELTWDFAPFAFLYDIYKIWFKKNSPSGSPQGRNTFINDLLNILPTIPDWMCLGKRVQSRPGVMMSKPEPLIVKWDLNDWKNPAYTGSDINKICTYVPTNPLRGIQRVGVPSGPAPQPVAPANDEEPQDEPAF